MPLTTTTETTPAVPPPPPPDAKLVTRTIHVPVKLSDVEIAMRARTLVATSRALADIKDQAKEAARDFKDQIGVKEAEIERLGEVVETGSERRPLVCAKRTCPERGVVEWVHLETMAVHEVEPLLPPEDDEPSEPQGDKRQPALPFPESAPKLAFAGVDEWGQVHEISAEQRDQLQMAIAEKRSLRCILASGAEVKLVAIQTEDGKAEGVRSPCDGCGVVGGDHRPDCTATKGDSIVTNPNGCTDPNNPQCACAACMAIIDTPPSQRSLDLTAAAEQRKAKWTAKGVETAEDGCPIGVDADGEEFVLTDAEGDELAELGAVEIDDPETTCIAFKELAAPLAERADIVGDVPDYSAAAKLADQQLVQTRPKRTKKSQASAEAGK